RGMRCIWKWNTDCPASAPLFCSKFNPFIPSCWNVSFNACASFGTTLNRWLASSAGKSYTFSSWFFGMTSKWPFVTGVMSINAKTCSSSYTFSLAKSPLAILQKIQDVIGTLPFNHLLLSLYHTPFAWNDYEKGGKHSYFGRNLLK